MATTTFQPYTGNGSNKTFNYSFPTYTASEVVVEVDGVVVDNYTIPGYQTTGTRTVTFDNSTGTLNTNLCESDGAPKNNLEVIVRRDTNIDTAKATYTAGSSLKAADLTNNNTQILRALQEEQNTPITTPRIRDAAITTAKIKADAIDSTKIADNSINSEHYVDGSIDHVHLANDIIDGDNIQNDVINSEHYAAGSIDLEHMSANSVDSDQYVDGSIDLVHMSANSVDSDQYVDGSIDRVHLAADIVDGTKIADDSIDSEHYVDGSIDTAHIANSQVTTAKIAADAITGAKIADDAIDSEHYTDGSIDTAHLANSAVTANKIADGTVGTLELANSSVTTAKIADANVTTAKIADSAITNAKINNLAVGNSKIYPQAVTYDKIATATIISGNIANGNIITDKIADNAVTTAKIANGNITTAKIGAGQVILDKLADNSVNTSRIIDNAVTIDKIADAAIVTNSEQASHSVDDNTFFTTAAAEARYFNASTGETIKDGQSFPDNDTTIATTAAINDRIIDLVDDVGGFVPIANETSFPNANPDVNNGTGTIVSISTLASNHTSNGSGTFTISNGTVGNSTVTINGAANNTTYSAGYGLLVETTTTLNTYTFHRLVPKATEVTTVAGKATEIGRLGTADAVADMAILGTADVVADLNTLGTADVVADMNMLAVSDVISDMNTLAVTDVINDMDTVAGAVTNVNNVGNSIANVNTTAGSISNVNTVAGSIGNVNTTAGSISNVNTTAGSIANVNSVASNMANVNNFADRYQIASNNPSTDGGGNALAAGDLYFNTSANELKVYNGSAWQSGVTATGSFALTTGNTFTGNNIFTAHNTYNDSVIAKYGTGEDLQIYHNGSHSYLDNSTGSLFVRGDTIKLRPKSVDEDGIEVFANGEVRLYYDNSKKLHTISTGVHVTGNITLPDDGEAKFGNSGDLAIYHNDSLGSSWIYNSTGELHIRSDSIFLRSQSDAASYINCTDNGSVDLYYNGSKKLETTAYGISIDNGSVKLENSGGNTILQNVTGALLLQGNGSDNTFIRAKSGENSLVAIPNGAVELYYDNSKKFETTTYGALVSGTFLATGNIKTGTDTGSFYAGAGDDLRIRHDGTDSRITNSTGYLYIDSPNVAIRSDGGQEDSIQALANGAVNLFHNGSKKFETTSGGAKVTGVLTSSITSGQAVSLADNAQIHLGTGDDLKIYHDGSVSRISDEGTGNLVLQTNGAGIELNKGTTENMLKAFTDGAVDLYYDGTKMFSTESRGAILQKADACTFIVGSTNAGTAQIFLDGDSNGDGNGGDYSGIRHTASGHFEIFADSPATTAEIHFKTGNGSHRSTIDASGHFKPAADSTYDLGLTGTRWRNLYADTLYGDGSNLTGINTDLVADTSPQLGGDLDLNGNSILLDDNEKIFIGTSNDGSLFNSGSYLFLKNHSGGVAIQGTNTVSLQKYDNADIGLQYVVDGQVKLYYDNTIKFGTDSAGVYARGDLMLNYADNYKIKLGAGNDLQMYHDGSNSYLKHDTSSGDLYIDAAAGTADIRMKARNHLYVTTNDTESAIEAYANSGVYLYYDTAEKFRTTSDGGHVTGSLTLTSHLVMGASDEIKMGGSSQMTIWHTGSDFNMYNNTGNIIIANASGTGTGEGAIVFKTGNNNTRAYLANDGHFYPASNNSFDLGTTSNRWRNVFTNDLHLSNKGHTNDVDGTWGDWTIQEGESDLFLKNNRSGKKYKFNLTEVS